MKQLLRRFAGLGLTALLASGMARAATRTHNPPPRISRKPPAVALMPRWHVGRILVRISRQEALLRVPPPVAVLVFDEGTIRGYDRNGWKRIEQPNCGYRAHTTTFHDRVSFQRHCLLTEGARDEVYLSLPPGTLLVRIQQAQEMFDGRLQALDAHRRELASERATDFQLVPVHSDPLALTIEGRMLFRLGRDKFRIRVPGGTRSLHLNGARLQDDGSILALDAHHRVLASQSAWNGCPQVVRYRPSRGPTLFNGNFPDTAYVRVVRGTREVDFSPQGVTLRDDHGRVLGRETGVEVVVHDR